MIKSKAEVRFTVHTGTWVALNLIDKEEGSEDWVSPSPIFVYSVEPQKTGQRLCRLKFFHANYPEGVQNKEYLLKTIEQTSTHWIAAVIQDSGIRQVTLEPLTTEWLREHFPELQSRETGDPDPQVTMNRCFPGVPQATSFS